MRDTSEWQSVAFSTNDFYATRYSWWAATVGLQGGAKQLSADPDGDYLPNLLEYAFGEHPLVRGDYQPIRSLGVERISFADGHKDYLKFTYRRRTEATKMGLVYRVEWNDSLREGNWRQAQMVELEVQEAGEGFEDVIAYLAAPLDSVSFDSLGQPYRSKMLRVVVELLVEDSP